MKDELQFVNEDYKNIKNIQMGYHEEVFLISNSFFYSFISIRLTNVV